MSPTNPVDEPLWYCDLTHIGMMCAKIRQSRGLRKCDVAEYTGLSKPTVSRLERNESTFKSFSKYVGGFRRGKPPLNAREVDHLVELYPYSQEPKIRELEAELATIDLRDICSASSPPQLKDLVRALGSERRPAFIRDDLWFVHAFNGAALHLFGVDFSKPENLSAWQAWQVIAVKFVPDSAVRRAHYRTDNYFRQAVGVFWKSLHRYLFTWQVRVLAHKIYELSGPNEFHFENWWPQAATFNLDYDLHSFTRALYHPSSRRDKDRLIHVQSSEPIRVEVEVVPGTGHTARYTLVVWNAMSQEAKELFADIAGRRDGRQILFAADYDQDNSFHVNKWPEVVEELDV